jgi:hypothetical protein
MYAEPGGREEVLDVDRSESLVSVVLDGDGVAGHFSGLRLASEMLLTATPRKGLLDDSVQSLGDTEVRPIVLGDAGEDDTPLEYRDSYFGGNDI